MIRFEAALLPLKIKGQKDRIAIPGFRTENGFFGIHHYLTVGGDDVRFVVTHLPSGVRMPGGPWRNPVTAASYCEMLSLLREVDWSSREPEISHEISAIISGMLGRMTE